MSILNKNSLKKEKIVLGGFAGSGKSTVAKIICRQLGYEFISVGNFARAYAKKEFGLSINEFQEKCKNEPHLDQLIDQKFQEKCNSSSKIVVDYRLGFKFVNNAFSVFLHVSDPVAAKRLSSDRSTSREKEKTDAASISKRNTDMRERFKELYQIDFADTVNYDLIVDTDKISPEEVAQIIIRNINLKH